MSYKSHICTNCGHDIPLLLQLNIVQLWKWKGIVSILLDEIPKIKCPGCGADIDIPVMTAFYSKIRKELLIHTGEIEDTEILSAFKEYANENQEYNFPIKLTKQLDDLKSAISAQVILYKPLLKELTIAHRDDNLTEFIAKKWLQITPDVLSSGLVGLTNLVKGIGGYVLNQETGEALCFDEAFQLFQELFSEVQLISWHQIIQYKWSADYSFENGLTDHIKEGGIYGDNCALFKETVQSVLQQSKENNMHPILAYTTLSLYASIAQIERIGNEFGAEWCQLYFGFELELMKGVSSEISLAHWRISDKRAIATIDEKNIWNLLAYMINKELNHNYKSADISDNKLTDLLEFLENVTSRLGHKDIVKRILGSGKLKVSSSSKVDIEAAILKVIDSHSSSPGEFVFVLNRFKDLLVSYGNTDIVVKIFNYVLAKLNHDRELQAELETWFGTCMKLLMSPKLFIENVGEEPRDWEYDLSLYSRIGLWNERANAFRLLSKQQKALDITEDLLNELKDQHGFDGERFVLLRNRGILLREVGSADLSYIQLKELFSECPLEDLVSLNETFAITCTRLWRNEEAIASIKKAISLVQKKNGSYATKLYADLALQYTITKQYDKALKILESITIDESVVLNACIASAYTNLFLGNVKLSESSIDRLEQLTQRLFDYTEKLEEQGNMFLLLQVLFMLTNLSYYIDPNKSETLWLDYLHLQYEHKKLLDPIALARLATIAYRKHKQEQKDEYLFLIPKALEQNYGKINDIAIGYDVTRLVCTAFDDLRRAALDNNAGWSDIRLISEFKRDTIGKAKLARNRDNSTIKIPQLRYSVCNNTIRSIAPKQGSIGVLEWITIDKCLIGLLTAIDSNGNVQTRPLDNIECDIVSLNNQILYRLNCWHRGRQGDPFDIPDWHKTTEWVRNEIEKYLDYRDHIIIINHESCIGFPWHVALSSHWRCSYTPSWSSILQSRDSSIHSFPQRLGIFAVSRYQDEEYICKGIEDSVKRSKDWSDSNSLMCDIYKNEHADQTAFEKLMSECDLVKLICHGYADPCEQEIALLVSYNNVLPPMYAQGSVIAKDTNLISWRDMQSLPRTPPVVLSAACSTGLQWCEGAGEQMGLLGALRNGGTRSLVGPRWDTDAVVVIDLLDEILESYLCNDAMLIDVVYDKCARLEKNLPKWLAWSVAIEGDWQ